MEEMTGLFDPAISGVATLDRSQILCDPPFSKTNPQLQFDSAAPTEGTAFPNDSGQVSTPKPTHPCRFHAPASAGVNNGPPGPGFTGLGVSHDKPTHPTLSNHPFPWCNMHALPCRQDKCTC